MAADRERISFLDLLPEIYRDPATRTFLESWLTPLEQVLDELETEFEGTPGSQETPDAGLLDLFDIDRTPPPAVLALHSDRQDFTMQCLQFVAGWLGVPVRPPPARSIEWNRGWVRRALELLPLHGTLPGIDAMLRAWLAGDIVDPDPPDPDGSRVLVVTDCQSPVNGGPSAFCLGLTSSLGLDTVLGDAPAGYLVVDVFTRPEERLLRHPVGVDGLRRAALFMLLEERPAHAHGQLRIRGHTMRLAPPGDPAAAPAGEVYAQLEPAEAVTPEGTALLWDAPLVVPFPDRTERST